MPAHTHSLADGTLDALDAARRRLLLSLSTNWPRLALVVQRRHSRFSALLLLSAVTAWLLAVSAPALLLVVGPLLLGVPHVVSDIRHLVLRRALPRGWVVALTVGCTLLLLLQVAEVSGAVSRAFRVEIGLATLLAAASALAGGRAAGRTARGSAIAALCLFGGAVMLSKPLIALVSLSHAHNLVALALFAVLFHRSWSGSLSILLVLVAALPLFSTGLQSWVVNHGVLSFGGLHLGDIADDLALSDTPNIAFGLGLSYAYLQAMHYTVWLHAIPQADIRAHGTLSFRQSLRSLFRDLGRWGLGIAVLLSILVMGAGLFAPADARHVYLTLAGFHVWLELAAIAFLLARGRRDPPQKNPEMTHDTPLAPRHDTTSTSAA